MHAMLVTVEIDPARADEARKVLDEFTVPTVKSQPGFVRGVWMRADDGTAGRGVVLFDSADQANAAAKLALQGPPPGAPVTIRSAEVFEVIAEA